MTSRPFSGKLWALLYFWASLLDFDHTDHLPSSFGFDISHTCYFSFYLRLPAHFSCPSLYILSPIPFDYFPAFISLFPPTFTCFSLLCTKCTSQSPSFLYLSFRLWVATPRYYKYLVLATQNGKGAQNGPSPQFSSFQFPLSLSSQFWSFGVLFWLSPKPLLSSTTLLSLFANLSELFQTCQNSSETHQQIFKEGILLCTTGSNPLSLCCLPLFLRKLPRSADKLVYPRVVSTKASHTSFTPKEMVPHSRTEDWPRYPAMFLVGCWALPLDAKYTFCNKLLVKKCKKV